MSRSMNSKRYVFGYGSILNPASMEKDIPAKLFKKWITINGYERIANVPVDGALALNLRPHPTKTVEGVLVEVDDEAMTALTKREKGYTAIDITSCCGEIIDGTVYSFIAPQGEFPDMHILKSYLDECLAGIPESLQENWLRETVLQNPVV
jgi:hypothetical protein